MKGELIRLATRIQGPGLTDEAYGLPKRMSSLAADVPEPLTTVEVTASPCATPAQWPVTEVANQATDADS